MITIIDYGIGNLKSIEKAFQFLGYQTQVSGIYEEIKKSKLLVLPGVGAFNEGIKNLKKLDLINFLKDYIQEGKPFLGICLGFQLLFESSEENGFYEGLGVFPGKIKLFDLPINLKVPHMGWNTLTIKNDSLNILPNNNETFYYFVHSYYLESTDQKIIASTTNYGLDFVSSIQTKNLFAAQFHPEKSGEKGMAILKNFCKKIL